MHFWVCPTKALWSLLFEVVGIACDGKELIVTKFPLYWTQYHHRDEVGAYRVGDDDWSKEEIDS